MGMGAEMLEDMMIDEMIAEERREDACRNGYWITRENDYIHVTKMTDSHLRNAIRYCERNPHGLAAIGLSMLEAEQERRHNAKNRRTTR